MSKTPLSALVLTERHQVRNLLVLLVVVLMAACLAPALALAGTAHELLSSFGRGGPGTHFCEEEEVGGKKICPEGSVGAGAVAVDSQTHVVYVADLGLGTVSKFDEDGNPVEFTAGPGAGTNDIGGFSFIPEEGVEEIAVNSATDVFYVADGGSGAVKAFHEDGEPAEFSAGASAGNAEITSFEGNAFGLVPGVAVDGNGDIYIGNYKAGAVQILKPSGEELTSFHSSAVSNVAVDSHGTVYVSGYYAERPGVEKFTPSDFPVTASTTYSSGASITALPALAIAVDRSGNELYAAIERSKAPTDQAQILQFDEAGTVLSEFAGPGQHGSTGRSEGVAPDEASGRVYVSDVYGMASDGQDERQVSIFTPPPPNPPVIESTTASGVTSTSISFEAQINPELFDTKYHFQYVQQSQFEVSGFTEAAETSGVDLGSAGRAKAAHGFAGGLAPDTTYRFRVVASNENGEVNTPEPAPQVTTFSIFSSGLPDGRAYEMVTPAHKIGEVFAPEPEQALGNTCDECLPGSNGQMMPMQSAPGGDTVAFQGQPFFAGFSASPNEYLGRRTASGWGAESLSSGAFNNFNEQGYMAFPTDLSRSVIYQHEPALSPDAPTRSGRAFDNLYLRDAGGAIQPLITSTDEPPHRSPEEATPDSNGFKVVYAGANAGTGASEPLSHVVFEANDALTGETAVAPKAAEIEPGERCRFTGDDCNLYEWDEGQLRLVNVLPSNASAAPAAVFGSGHELASPQLEAPAVDHAISDDGSRIFWSTPDGQVYVRIDGQETVEVKDHNGRFLTASPDGKKVVLSDGCLYDLEVEQCEDLTQDHSDVHQGGFTGVLGAAEDLSRVYFIDTKILSGEEANANKEKPEDGAFNLYVWQKNAPATFIGGLLPADNARGGNDRYGAWKAAKANRTAQVSPDGRFLTFMSQAALTGYDNAVAGSGSCRLSNTPACSEVFEYDAGAKTLTCVSCNPTGQRPLGPSSLSLIRGAPALPPVRQPDNLTADGEGRIFFESQDVLSPYDTNGHIQDVYEWEPPGVGGCELARGCVFLISSGHGVDDSMFLDSSETGNDAFFVTRERLIAADKDELLDLYDARAPHIQGEAVGFGESVTAPCEGEACQGAPATPPVFGPPASATFSGPGNLASPPVPKANVTPKRLSRAQRLANALRACAKKPKRQRRACRARAEKRYGPVKAKRKHKDNKGGK